MTAKEFWKAFRDKLNKKDIYDEAQEKWNYSKDYTEFIIGMMEGIIGSKDKGGIGLETSKEYYRIDLTGWTQRRKEIKDKLLVPENRSYSFQTYCWDLEIAIEHENSDKLWMDEIIKLLHIRCPLRVVVGYVPKALPKEPYLEYVSKAIVESNKVANISDGCFLVLLGDSKVGKNGKKCNYTPYEWDVEENTFKLLKN